MSWTEQHLCDGKNRVFVFGLQYMWSWETVPKKIPNQNKTNIKHKKKKEKKKTNKASIYIYAYQLMVGYSKSSKTLLCQSFPGRNQCLLQGSIV